jgi:transcriptional regulator with GAF, ATPase, and Fis domain
VVLAERKMIESEEFWEKTRGQKRWWREVKFPFTDYSGETMIGGLALDITKLKQAEEKLKKAYNEIKELKDRIERENIYLREELEINYRHREMVGESTAIQKTLHQAEKVANEETTVLILGETGTGKELLARAIHRLSPRKDGHMVKVNCAALPANLVESELFGREKGAFTGAMARQLGRFESADGSTIFLDEIGDLPLELQTKLLRVLQDGQFERLGSVKTISVDVRVIAATNRDLRKAVREGRFRRDLYYRLNVFPITVPPLRERRDDIPLLTWAFVKHFSESMGKQISTINKNCMDRLKAYSWPGNVRELKNVIERSMILSTGPVLHIGEIESDATEEPLNLTLDELERAHILKVLENTGWRVRGDSGAARILGLKPTTLEARMRKLGIQRGK